MHTQGRGIFDTVASLIGHGLLSRFPTLRILPVENGSGWVRPLIEAIGQLLRARAGPLRRGSR